MAAGAAAGKVAHLTLDERLDTGRTAHRQVAHYVGKLGALGFEVTLARIPGPTIVAVLNAICPPANGDEPDRQSATRAGRRVARPRRRPGPGGK